MAANSGLYTYAPINYNLLDIELNNALDFSGQLDLLASKLLLSVDELDQRIELANILTHYARKTSLLGQFYLFGSSASTLGFKDSDLDLYYELDVIRYHYGGDCSTLTHPEVCMLVDVNE